MKKIGLVGGIGPASMVEYYLGLIQKCQNELLKSGIVPVIPTDEDIVDIGRLIYPNLENGIGVEEDKAKLLELAEKYIAGEKTDALLLGCTELSLTIKETDVNVPLLNSTEIHINAIYYEALKL